MTAGEATPGDLDLPRPPAVPRWQRRAVAVFAVLFVVTQVLVWTSIRDFASDRQAYVSQTVVRGTAQDLVRELTRAEVDLLAGATIADLEVRRGLVARQLQILRARADLGETVIDSAMVDAIVAPLVRADQALRNGDRDGARAGVADAAAAAKRASDLVERETYDTITTFIDDEQAARRLEMVVATLTVALGLGVFIGYRHRYRSAQATAYARLAEQAEEIRDRAAAAEVVNAQLEQANERLRDVDAAKDDFISMVSHELRTPLTSIRGFAETLVARDDELPSDVRQRAHEAIARQARRQERLIDDLLVMAALIDRGPRCHVEDVPVAQVLALVARDVHDMPGLLVDVGDDVLVRADAHHLEQIVTNFVHNARKYGGPNVWITSEVSDDHVDVVVADDGPGVPAAFVEHLFERFAQHDRGDRRAAQGVGLGLAIARGLARANGGDVFHRPNLPTGAQFVVRLPRAHVVAGPLVASRVAPVRLEPDAAREAAA